MNCGEARKLVHLFVDGALDPRANVDVLSHLNLCPACSGRFEEAKKFEEFLRSQLRPPAVPEGVRLRIEARLTSLAQPWPLRFAAGLRRHPMAAMSGLAAVLAISLVSWQVCGVMFTCPYVRASADRYQKIAAGHLALGVPSGPGGAIVDRMPPPPQIHGLRHNGTGVVAMDPAFRDAVAYAYSTEHCPKGATCAVLFMVSLPGVDIGTHDCVEKDGRRFTRWEYDGCHVVCWKDEKHGLYCMLVCKRQEMEPDALLNVASVAATQ